MQGDHVTVVWSTRENGAGSVRYSVDNSFSRVVAARVRFFSSNETGMQNAFYQYQADITGLAPGQRYVYRAYVGADPADGSNPNTPDPTYNFTTPGSDKFTFLVIGDTGDGSFRQLNVAGPFNKENAAFVLHVGDIAYDTGTYDEFTNNYFGQYPLLMRRVPFFAVAGNHEWLSSGARPYMALNVNPAEGVPPVDSNRYFSFDWGGGHFIGIDSDLVDGYHQADMARLLQWLENDLANSTALWKVAFWHHTPYPVQHHTDDPTDTTMRQQINPILERYGVQMVFSGHEHNYMRSKPLHGAYGDLNSAGNFVVPPNQGTLYITSGGGGGVLHPSVDWPFVAVGKAVNHYLRVDVNGGVMTVHAIACDATVGPPGTEFDKVTVTLPPALGIGTPVVSAASFQPAVAPGTLISIFGQAIANSTVSATTLPLPTTLGGSTVTLNGKPLPLVFAAPTQINAALPFDAPLGQSTLRVTTPAGFTETQFTISETAPAIFPGAITHADGSLVTASSPAQPGEAVIIYMTGLGQVDGVIAAGAQTPQAPLLRALASVQVSLGDTNPVTVTPFFAGLAPGFVGLFQVNVTIPSNLTTKSYPLRVTAKGNPSNPQTIPVQQKIVP